MPKRKYQTPEIMHDAPLTDSKAADFHFDDFAATLARLIASPNTETPLAIGINGAWGSGKTSLLLRVKHMLDKPKGEDGKGEHRFAYREEKDFRKCKTVWFDAWKYNDEDKLLVALVRVILQAMQRDGLANNLKAWLNDPTQKTYDVVAMFINAFEASFGGLKFNLDLEKHAEASSFEKYTAFFDYFDNAFSVLLKAWSGNGALVVFIDDLDRCLPAKTVQTLEAIKLFLDKSGCVFVLGADIKIVQAAVETHYENKGIVGEGAKDYLEKVIQLRFNLPPILEDAMSVYLLSEKKVDVAMQSRWRALIAAADVNPRRVKNVINDLNLQWYMAVNSGQAENVNRDDFICWQALMHAAPAAFVRQVMDIEDNMVRYSFVLDALKWQTGAQAEKDAVKGFFGAYEDRDSRRLRSVLKQISFSADFDHATLAAMIYMAAPPHKLEPVKPAGIASEEALGIPVIPVKEPESIEVGGEVTFEGKLETVYLRRDGNRLTIGGLDFMRVPAGKFVMGSKDDNELAQDREKPQHTVDINYDYWMAKFILTNEQYAQYLGKQNHPVKDWQKKKDYPVVNVSWSDATKYCQWFNEQFKSDLGDLLLRLPIEVEWEKAARGAYGNEWPWGNEFDANKCNSVEGRKGGTTPVGAYAALGGDSPYGCSDMAGNVWEWCNDWYNESEYKSRVSKTIVNPIGPQRGQYRLLRGGSFSNLRLNARCAYRSSTDPDFGDDLLGIRVCIVPHHASGI